MVIWIPYLAVTWQNILYVFDCFNIFTVVSFCQWYICILRDIKTTHRLVNSSPVKSSPIKLAQATLLQWLHWGETVTSKCAKPVDNDDIMYIQTLFIGTYYYKVQETLLFNKVHNLSNLYLYKLGIFLDLVQSAIKDSDVGTWMLNVYFHFSLCYFCILYHVMCRMDFIYCVV